MKNWILISIILVLTISNLRSQIIDKLTIEAYYQPNIASVGRIDEYYFEENKIGYQIGFGAFYELNNYFDLYSGLNFSNKGYKHNLEFKYEDLGVPLSDYVKEMELFYNYYYLGLPLATQLSLDIINKINIGLLLGVNFDIYIRSGTNDITKYFDGSTKEHGDDYGYDDYLSKFNLTTFVGLNINYQINSKIAIFIQPTVDYSIFEYVKNDDFPMNGNFNDKGIRIGLKYKFK